MTLRLTEPIAEMSNRKLSENKAWPIRKYDKLTAICYRIV